MSPFSTALLFMRAGAGRPPSSMLPNAGEIAPMKLTHLALILLSIAPVDRAAQSPWLIPAADRRIPVQVQAGRTPRLNKALEVTIDFGKDQIANLRSLNLIEIDNTGSVLDDAVPFQFDP